MYLCICVMMVGVSIVGCCVVLHVDCILLCMVKSVLCVCVWCVDIYIHVQCDGMCYCVWLVTVCCIPSMFAICWGWIVLCAIVLHWCCLCCGVLCLVWVGCICCLRSVYGVVRHGRVVWVVGVECHAIECGMCI